MCKEKSILFINAQTSNSKICFNAKNLVEDTNIDISSLAHSNYLEWNIKWIIGTGFRPKTKKTLYRNVISLLYYIL